MFEPKNEKPVHTLSPLTFDWRVRFPVVIDRSAYKPAYSSMYALDFSTLMGIRSNQRQRWKQKFPLYFSLSFSISLLLRAKYWERKSARDPYGKSLSYVRRRLYTFSHSSVLCVFDTDSCSSWSCVLSPILFVVSVLAVFEMLDNEAFRFTQTSKAYFF